MIVRFRNGVLFGIFAIQTLLLVYSSKVHSPTWDEVGHLAAGISHWELGRTDLYPVNPPLVRTIAAAPVVAIDRPEMSWENYRTNPVFRSEVFVGRRMMQENGKDSLGYFFHARLALIPIALLGGWLCFLWGRDLFGERAGLLAAGLWAFSPNILAYGSVITPDLSSAVALLGCSYLFFRWLKDSSLLWSSSLGLAMAFAMLTKTVWLILPVVFLMIWAGYRLLRKGTESSREESSRGWLRPAQNASLQSLQLIGASLLAIVFTNGFYGFGGSLKPLGSYEFVSQAFGGETLVTKEADPDCEDCEPTTTFHPDNRFRGSVLASLPVPLPSNYLKGIDLQVRDFERGAYDSGWKSYLSGTWKQGGWWYYYLVGFLVKVPLGIWLLFALSACLGVLSFRKGGWERDRVLGLCCLLIPALLMLMLVSTSTGLNRYFRYALPVLPAIIIVAAAVGRTLHQEFASAKRSSALITACVAGACIWVAGSTLWYAPHHLSYFNELAGGPEEGHQYLCDSNVDWGQDLTYLEAWLEEHPEVSESLRLAYFGSFDPASVGISYRLPPPMYPDASSRRVSDQVWMGPHPGWYVVSKNYVVGHSMPIPDGLQRMEFKYFGEPVFSYFSEFEPVDRIGYSMLVYKLSPEDVNKVRTAKGLVPLSLPSDTSQQRQPSLAATVPRPAPNS